MSPEEKFFSKPFIVWLILNHRTEDALSLLAEQYKVTIPRIKVGLPKRHKRNVLACYQSRNVTISVFNSDILSNPFVVLHEFYHHLRTSVDRQHKGAEKNADRFASEFLDEYRLASAKGAR